MLSLLTSSATLLLHLRLYSLIKYTVHALVVVGLELAGVGNCGGVLRRMAADHKSAWEKWKRKGARGEREEEEEEGTREGADPQERKPCR